MIKIQLTDDSTAAILSAIENGTDNGQSITRKAVCAALGGIVSAKGEAASSDETIVNAAVALMTEQGDLDGFIVLRGKNGGFSRPDVARERKNTNNVKNSEAAAKKLDKLRSQLAALAAAGVDVSALVEHAKVA